MNKANVVAKSRRNSAEEHKSAHRRLTLIVAVVLSVVAARITVHFNVKAVDLAEASVLDYPEVFLVATKSSDGYHVLAIYPYSQALIENFLVYKHRENTQDYLADTWPQVNIIWNENLPTGYSAALKPNEISSAETALNRWANSIDVVRPTRIDLEITEISGSKESAYRLAVHRGDVPEYFIYTANDKSVFPKRYLYKPRGSIFVGAYIGAVSFAVAAGVGWIISKLLLRRYEAQKDPLA